MSLSVGYENIMALMNMLHDGPKQVRIDSVGINSDQQDSVYPAPDTVQGYLECGMTVTINVIRRKEEYFND